MAPDGRSAPTIVLLTRALNSAYVELLTRKPHGNQLVEGGDLVVPTHVSCGRQGDAGVDVIYGVDDDFLDPLRSASIRAASADGRFSAIAAGKAHARHARNGVARRQGNLCIRPKNICTTWSGSDLKTSKRCEERRPGRRMSRPAEDFVSRRSGNRGLGMLTGRTAA